ncbi:50S ribosomal protein L6 [bacterium]|nr:50S ribosomal protein L6 [bacterium]
MSRIGKQPVQIPSGVEVKLEGGNLSVKGPLGQLTQTIRPEVNVSIENNQIIFAVDSDEYRSYWGLTRALVNGMVQGVSKGFTKVLEVIGVGYRVELKKEYIVFFLGHSHEIWYEVPAGITAAVKDNKLTLTSPNKQQLGQVSAVIRSLRKPEPYKGKGIKYSTEVVKRKAGKTGKGGKK